MNQARRPSSLFLLTLFVALVAIPPRSSEAAGKARLVGTAGKGVNAVEYIGVIQQNGFEFLAVGYLTHVQGLDPEDLFTDPQQPDASTARFTFSGSSGLVSRAQVGAVTQLDAAGTLTIYFNELGGADLEDLDSFSSGTEIASFDTRFQNVLAVIAPDEGVSSGTAHMVQRKARRFVLEGEGFRFGRRRLVQRLSVSGRATRSQADPPVSLTEFAASGIVP